MAIDTRKVILAAVQAALQEDESPTKRKQGKRGLSAGRALLLGAGLMTAGRLAVGSRGRELMGSLQDRLGDFEERFLSDEDGQPEDLDDDEELLDEDEEEVEDGEPVASE